MRFFFYVFFCAVCFLSGGGCEGEGLIERDGEMSGIGVQNSQRINKVFFKCFRKDEEVKEETG